MNRSVEFVKIHRIEQSSPVQDLSPRPELRALTGLRGLAATAVAVAHFQNAIPAYSGTPFMWHNAVDLFFCLSGFTLSYVYNRETFQFSSYLTARVARIYPLYLVCLIAAGSLYVWPSVVNPISYPVRTAVSDFALQLAMLNAWPVVGSGAIGTARRGPYPSNGFATCCCSPFSSSKKRRRQHRPGCSASL